MRQDSRGALRRVTSIGVLRIDTLSDILRALRITSGFFLEAEFTAPWCIDSSPRREAVRRILPNAEHVAVYHVVTEGTCRVRPLAENAWTTLVAGDVILFPQSDAHLLGSDLQLAPVQSERLVQASHDGGLPRIQHGGDGARTRFVCGFLACDSRLCRPLLSALPSMVKVHLGAVAPGAWLLETLRRGAEETRAARPGSEAVLAKLAELAFVEAIRAYIEQLPEDEKGWCAAVRDTFVSRALALMHAEPARAWTVDALGREVGLSRSALAERFSLLLNVPPMQYLTRTRMALAARALQESSDPVLRIAAHVGYDSEAAFNRAFKREFGMPPASWRRQSDAHAAAERARQQMS
jgi:AraC family transcriptional regulator, alkane utilization regulator